ncbi:MAG: glycosyltransferase family 2 protein [Clostridia bacterium]|nr:glycosyltransferase family 2 protein [Clostridia bacterium]
MEKISIIIPVYNVEKYLDKCLNSIVNQTYENIEVLVINDGTKDNSQEIIDLYKNKYPNKIYSFTKENGGLSDARNYGIDKATGDYITFIDSDDYIDVTMIEKLYNKIKMDNADVSACECYFEYEKKIKRVGLNIDDNENIKDIMIKLFPSAWGKLYKKHIFINNNFKKGIWFEDVEFLMRVYPTISKVSVVKEPLYYYIQRENSITYTYNEKLNDLITNWDGIIKYYKQESYYEEYKNELEYSFIRYVFATYIKRLAKAKDYNRYCIGVRTAIHSVKSYFPDYKNNKYLKSKSPKNLYLKYFNKNIANIIFFLEKNKKN